MFTLPELSGTMASSETHWKRKFEEEEIQSGKRSPNGRDQSKSITAETGVSEASAQMSREELLSAQIFNLPELREMVIGHVIENEIKRGDSMNDILSMRLVSKSWLEDTNNFLLKSGQPLYKLQLTHENSVSRCLEVQENGGKQLDKFIEAMTSPARMGAKFPPFSLEISRCFFREENYMSFSNFLSKCAPGLVKLGLIIPWGGGSLAFLYPDVDISFPNLQALLVSFPYGDLECCVEEEGYSNESNSVAIPFIQRILSGSGKLKNFKLLDLANNIPSLVPNCVRFLKFPPTITSLCIASVTSNLHLGSLLLSSDLPNLRRMHIRIYNEPGAANLIASILRKFRLSIEDLHIQYLITLHETETPPDLFQFPLAKKMRRLYFSFPYAELSEEHPPVQQLTPNLKDLYLMKQSIRSIQKWIRNSEFPNVTLLGMSPTEGIGQLHTLNLANRFTNVRSLWLEVKSQPQTGDLTPIFKDMTQLKILDLSYFTNRVNENDNWDSTLTGIPTQHLTGNQDSIEVLSRNLDLHGNRNMSIANLQELESLMLRTCVIEIGTERSLISDHVFHLAFLHMKNLKTLEIERGFKVSAEMAGIWRGMGGILFEEGATERKLKAYMKTLI